VNQTVVPTPPLRTRLKIVEVRPQRIEVTYPVCATGANGLLTILFMTAGFLPVAILSIVIGAAIPWLGPRNDAAIQWPGDQLKIWTARRPSHARGHWVATPLQLIATECVGNAPH